VENEQLIFLSLIFAGTGLVLIPLLPPALKSVAAFVLVLLCAVTTAVPAIQALTGHTTEIHLRGSSFFNDVPIRIDALSAWFMLIINLTCINGALYGIGYMKPYEHQKGNTSLHWVLFLLFQASMLWVCMLQHGLAFLLAWEIMSVSSLLLVMFEHQRAETIKAGLNYLVQMHIAVVCLSIAFIRVYVSEGSFDFTAIASFFMHQRVEGVFLLFFTGFGIKAGFVPLHTWLPHAHPAAPSHISGVMSGVIVKLGIYGILRMVLYLNTGLLRIGELLLLLSVITVFYGILNAAVHRDFKRMLAFCTIENIGIIGMGTALGMIGKGIGNPFLLTIGFSGALLHVFNHSLYKSLLFFSAGNVYQQTHTRNMEQLGGLIRQMPSTAFFFLAGALAICGLPPLNGFVSEFLIYSGLLEGVKSNNIQLSLLMILSVAGFSIAGGISILSFTKSFGTIFLGSPRTVLAHPPVEVSLIMRLPLYFLSILLLLGGLFPHFILIPVLSVVSLYGNPALAGDLFLQLSGTLTQVGRFSSLLLLLIAILYYIRVRITAGRVSVKEPTWGCGYVVPNSRMQYTGKSFSKTLAKLFSFITSEKKRYPELEAFTYFPKPRKYQSYYPEFMETRVFDKVKNRVIGFFNYFTFIHNGQLQRYILYGLFFIILILVGTLFNLL
jgi:hydrogenase-4 component B